MIFKPNTNTSIDIKLPIEAANWDSYSVELQLMNDAKNKVPSFNNISMITNSHSAKGFQLVAWNASGTSLSYRIAVTVHVFDAKQYFSVTPIHFMKVTTDPEFTISGCVVNGLATIYCRWTNKGQFQKKAWDGVLLASMDVRAVMEGFGVFVDSQQGSQMQNRLLYVVGSSVYFRPAYDATILANTWHAGSISFPVTTV